MRQRLRGPAACLRSRWISAPCATCGVKPEVCHMPTQIRGFFCEAHCPACHPENLKQAVLAVVASTREAQREAARR